MFYLAAAVSDFYQPWSQLVRLVRSKAQAKVNLGLCLNPNRSCP